jgi:hypothetical protein
VSNYGKTIHVKENENESKDYLVSLIGINDIVELSTHVLTGQK